MTSSVNVAAKHGWAMSLQPVDPKTGEKQGSPIIVPKGETYTDSVHSGRDLLVHEIQPEEEAAASEPATEEAQVEGEVDKEDEDD